MQKIYLDHRDDIIFVQVTVFSCCGFISDSTLVRTARAVYRSNYLSKSSQIYRCWIVWGCNISIVIVPSILAFACLGPSINRQSILTKFLDFNPLRLAIWIVGGAAYIIGGPLLPAWNGILSVTGIALSMTVNALAMGLIVFKIIRVFREVNSILDERPLGITGGSTLRSIIFVLIESGMILFFIQLVRLVLGILAEWSGSLAAIKIYPMAVFIHQMFKVIIRSDISIFHFADNVATRV